MIIPLLFPIFSLAEKQENQEKQENPSCEEMLTQISDEKWRDAIKCISDLVKLNKNKTKKNIALFKRKWPNFDKQIILNDIMCKIASEKGVWELVNEISKTK